MPAESTRPVSRRARLLALVIAVLILPLLLLLSLEGASSFVLLARGLHNPEPAHELGGRRLIRQDSLLGWVSTPGISVPNMYGPGAGLHVDARGFRIGRQGDSLVGGSPVRAVCSGDSFTFGAGVADDRTWCALLGRLMPGLATVNMGQSGYGVDQAYLWYKRDGAGIAHDAQVFAYITDDLHRMQVTTSYGSAKPRLELRNDSLVTTNVPVPRHDADK